MSDDFEEASIDIDTASLSFNSQGGTSSFSVTTNRDSYAAFPTADWLHVKQDGSTVSVTADANTSLKDREATVVVDAGVSKVVAVHQDASAAYATTDPAEVHTDQWGGTFTVDVDVNSSEFSIKTVDTWLTAQSKSRQGQIVLTISENKERADRHSVIDILVDGKAVGALTVTQDGTLYYALPYLGWGGSVEAMSTFEKARHSSLYNNPYSEENGSGKWAAVSISPCIANFYYTFTGSGLQTVTMYVMTSDNILAEGRLPDYIAWLTGKGFTALEANKRYVNRELQTMATIFQSNSVPKVVFDPYIPEALNPTWETLPLGYVEGVGKADLDDIKAWEAKHGGTFVETKTNSKGKTYHYFRVDNDPIYVERTYFMNSSDASYFSDGYTVVKDYTKAYFKTAAGTYQLTKPFQELLSKMGYSYFGRSGGQDIFTNDAAFIAVNPTKTTDQSTDIDGVLLLWTNDMNAMAKPQTLSAKKITERISRLRTLKTRVR